MNLTDGTVRAQAGYSYDTAGRVAAVGDGGDTLTYAYAPGTGRVAGSTWTTAIGNNSAYTYDSYHRLTGIAVNNTPVYGYTLNDKNQRTAATLENGDNWAYTYDTLGQLTGALKKDSQDNTLNNMSYAFDLIGNRTTATEDAANWTYASNLLNQYTQVNALLPTYDADGNMLTWNGWTYTWNGENRLASATNGNTRLEFDYDFLGRRIFKKVYNNNTLTEHRKFAYNGYKLVAEFDALNNNALLANYLWQPVGLDVPLRATIDEDARYFIADGNKNIIALKDVTGTTTDDYTYTPFGTVTASGSTDNPFRFSSEYHDAETGLVYYNYRYYSPILGRWTTRDPIEENGEINLYGFVGNSSVFAWDYLGFLTGGLDKSGKNGFQRYARKQALKQLEKWKKEKLEELEGKLKELCPEICCLTKKNNRVYKEECEESARSIAAAIIKSLEELIKNRIDRFNSWPLRGWGGNFEANMEGNGIRCDQWSDAVAAGVVGAGSSAPKNIFRITNKYRSGPISGHAWNAVYGPCNQTNIADFDIDLWASAGNAIDYTVKESDDGAEMDVR